MTCCAFGVVSCTFVFFVLYIVCTPHAVHLTWPRLLFFVITTTTCVYMACCVFDVVLCTFAVLCTCIWRGLMYFIVVCCTLYVHQSHAVYLKWSHLLLFVVISTCVYTTCCAFGVVSFIFVVVERVHDMLCI